MGKCSTGVARQFSFTLIRQHTADKETGDSNYIFLHFVLKYMQVGLLGLIIAAAFYAAIIAEVGVVLCFLFTNISYLWYNVVGCLLVIIFSIPINHFLELRKKYRFSINS